MLFNFLSTAPVWSLQADGGGASIDFDSMLEMDHTAEDMVASEPVEKGSFASYNKQAGPREITVVLACTKTYAEQQGVLDELDKLASGTQKVSLVTPASEYKDLNVQSYSYTRKPDGGAQMLVVELKLVEVREVDTKVKTAATQSIAAPKNPANASTAKTGKTQAQAPKGKRRSWLRSARNWLGGY